jgi:hypothetical protein
MTRMGSVDGMASSLEPSRRTVHGHDAGIHA